MSHGAPFMPSNLSIKVPSISSGLKGIYHGGARESGNYDDRINSKEGITPSTKNNNA